MILVSSMSVYSSYFAVFNTASYFKCFSPESCLVVGMV